MEPARALSNRTLEWVVSETGAASVSVLGLLPGGLSGTIHALRIDGAEAVLREMTAEPWRSSALELLEREAGVLEELVTSDPPTPRLLAVDARALAASEPSLLMTRLPGRTRLADPALGALAATLVRIHALVPSERPRAFQLWTDPTQWVVPTWAREPATFERAFAHIAAPPQEPAACFLHRDYQPGNVLFEGDRVTGVVDWVETSWGPPDLDVAHCATNLALLCGIETALAWPGVYRAAGGRLSRTFTYWALVDAVSFLPDPGKLLAAWHATGRRDLTETTVRERHEAYLAALAG